MDDDEARLVKDLFKGYNETVRPTEDKQLPIEVKFGIAYTQIVDLVCFLKNDIFKAQAPSYIERVRYNCQSNLPSRKHMNWICLFVFL